MGRERKEVIICPTASRSREVPCAANRGQCRLKVSAGAGPRDTLGPRGYGPWAWPEPFHAQAFRRPQQVGALLWELPVPPHTELTAPGALA